MGPALAVVFSLGQYAVITDIFMLSLPWRVMVDHRPSPRGSLDFSLTYDAHAPWMKVEHPPGT